MFPIIVRGCQPEDEGYLQWERRNKYFTKKKVISKNFRGDQAIKMAGGLLDSYKVLKEKEGSLEKA